MPQATVNGLKITYAETGAGFPLVWCHEFAGSMESWAPQVSFFSPHYRVITYNARGYPPSHVPTDPHAYSQDRAVEDLYQLLRSLDIRQAYVGGLSMGGSTALHFGTQHPDIARALIVAATGTGSTDPVLFHQQCEAVARRIENGGMAAMQEYAAGPTRVQLRRKDPAAWEQFAQRFAAHSPVGSALTMRGVQAQRPSIFDCRDQLRALDLPTLIMAGDEDEPCLEPALFLKRNLPRAGLVLFPQSGHTINLEEPDRFNRAVLDFLTAVEAGAWAQPEESSGVGFLTSSPP